MKTTNDRLDLALKASNEGIWDWNFESGEIYYSNRVLGFLGYGRIGAPNVFEDPGKYVHPDDFQNFMTRFERVTKKNGRLFAIEPRIKTNDGEWKWFRVRAIPKRNDEGEVIRLVGSLIDISKRRIAENELVEERRLIDLVLDSVPVNVYFKDRESRFVRANVATAERMGAGTVAELIGKTDHDFFDSEHADVSRSREIEIMETGVGQEEKLEHEFWDNGRETWVLVTKKIWRNTRGKVLGTFGVTHEVTELVETKRNLERVAQQLRSLNQETNEERNLLRMLIDNIPVFVYFKDLDSNFVLVNQEMADFLGEDSPDALIGKHDRDYFREDLSKEAQSDEAIVMETGVPVIQKLEEIVWKDHHVTWALASKFPWRDPDGKIRGTYGISTDVTELVETRNQLEEVANELSRQNKRLEEELSLAREIQQAAVPQSLPQLAGDSLKVAFNHCYRPASELAGDFLEVMPTSPDVAGFLVCDVMGHGVRSALIVAMLRGLIEKQRASIADPGAFLSGLNDGLSHLLARTGEVTFATACYGVVDIGAGEIRVASAGHPAPLVKIGGKVRVLDELGEDVKGPALGMLPGMPFQEVSIPLKDLECLWAFTDGVFEVRDGEEREFGLDRMMAILEQGDGGGETLELLSQKAREFSEEQAFDDDVCILAVEISDRA